MDSFSFLSLKIASRLEAFASHSPSLHVPTLRCDQLKALPASKWYLYLNLFKVSSGRMQRMDFESKWLTESGKKVNSQPNPLMGLMGIERV
jgi:hypothetical protein